MSTPSDPKPPSGEKGAPAILGMGLSTGQTLSCEEEIDVEWEKDDCDTAACDATVSLVCYCSYHQAHMAQLPGSQPAPAMLSAGTTSFTLDHPPDFSEDNVEVKATITMSGGATNSMSRTVNVRCDMMAEAKDAAAEPGERPAADNEAREAERRPAEPITLDPAIPDPIRLIPRRDAILLGEFRALKGDTVSVAILAAGASSDRVVAEVLATVRPGPTSRRKSWYVRLPEELLPQKCDWPRLTLRLTLWKAGQVVRAKTFLTVVLCDRG